MINKIKFSVGIPAYKSHFLNECISSILNQSYTEFELIIVNDYSPHPIDEIVEQFNDNRIRYFKNIKNTGAENVANNFNNCLEKAQGDFFILMGDDDKMEPDYLEEFVNLINKYPTLDVYHCRSLIIDENSQPISLTPSCPEFESVYDNIWHRISGRRSQFISDFVYRTSALKELGGFYYMPLAWASDDISAYRSCGDKGIAYINKPVFNYRINRYTISHGGNDFLKMSAIKREEEWLKIFVKDSPKFPLDLIIYKDICNKIDKYIMKKKIITIAISLQNHSILFSSVKWWLQRKCYGLNTFGILYSVLEALKSRYVRYKFKG